VTSLDSSYYDREAAAYDESRGGTARARAAADAVLRLVPPRGTCLDLGGGTGIVSAELAQAGLSVLVADLSTGMLRVAGSRLPGRALAVSADRLPVASGSVDLVTAVWLLHLLPVEVADGAIAEAARVLRSGGHFVTTVDKDLAHGRGRRTEADARDRVVALAAEHGLVLADETSFAGATKWATSGASAEQVFRVAALRKE
jgi:ubiquinone/menaquinone biosynthesis C-methylase UbiE